MYILHFNIIKLNELDNYGNTPLYYLIKNNSEDTKKNKELFVRVSSLSNIHLKCSDGVPISSLMNEWQKYVYDKYIKNSIITDHISLTE
jgi:hypothetical protein